MQTARHDPPYPPREEEYLSVTEKHHGCESYFWSVNESSWISTLNMNQYIPVYFEAHHLFKDSASCQNQVSNLWVIKVSVLKSLAIPPQEVHCHTVTCVHLMFVSLEANLWQHIIFFPTYLKSKCTPASLMHVLELLWGLCCRKTSIF